MLQVYGMLRARNVKQLNVLRPGRGIQNAVKNRTDQQILESVERTDRSHEQNRRQNLPPIRKRIPDEAGQLPHGAPVRCRPQLLAAGGMGMRCKALFYLSRTLVEWRFGVPGDVPIADPGTLEIPFRRRLN